MSREIYRTNQERRTHQALRETGRLYRCERGRPLQDRALPVL